MHWNNTSSTIFFRFSLISQSILNRFSRNFAGPLPSHGGDCPENLAKFDWVLQKLLPRCTETALFQRRQSAVNAGPSLKQHWVSAPPSYMYDWAVQTDWQIIQSKRVIANTPATLIHYLSPSFFFFFFFFFFFKLWYLPENEREEVAFPKYPLLREL